MLLFTVWVALLVLISLWFVPSWPEPEGREGDRERGVKDAEGNVGDDNEEADNEDDSADREGEGAEVGETACGVLDADEV